MGCKGSKNATDPQPGGGEEEAENPGAGDEAVEQPPDDGQELNPVNLDDKSLQEILKACEASESQIKFGRAWFNSVFSQAADPKAKKGKAMLVSSDASSLDISASCLAKDALALAKVFLDTMGAPTTQFEELKQVQDEVANDSTKATVYCKFKHMGAGSTNASVDCGVLLHEEMKWATVDILMPVVQDQDTFLSHAMSEHITPTSYGSSIFPVEPERRLLFEVESDLLNRKRHLRSALFFFWSLGFAKPDDTVIGLLTDCPPQKFTLDLGMGPKGLTRLAVSFRDSETLIGRDLAKALMLDFNERIFKLIRSTLGTDPDMIDYGVNSKGYAVGIGFTL